MNIKNTNDLFLILGLGIVLCIVIFNCNHGFFWDGVHYSSIQPNFYYATQFSSLWIPNAIESGEVPSFAIYIAAVWTMFGRTLTVSHLAMLPFVIGIVFQLFSLCRKFIKSEFAGIALLLVLADTTLLSQISLVSPDLPLLFFFLLGLNALLENKKITLSICIFFLFLSITRGLLLAFCLLLLDLYLSIKQIKNKKEIYKLLLKKSVIYIPGLILFLIYNYYHYINKGWVLTHQDSPWKDTQEVVNGKELLFNIALLCWRLIDFGKIIIWIILFILLIKLKKQIFKKEEFKLLILLASFILFFVHIDMLWAKNLLAHRYFMPFNIVFSLLCASILFSDLVTKKVKFVGLFLWFGVLISGSFWIYPDKIAKGWDSTLAHLPYYELRREAIKYLDEKKIDFKQVSTFFPNTASLDLIDLNHDHRNFRNYDDKSLYVFYSNIYNINDEDYDAIHNKNAYELIKEFENKGVRITIFKKR
jgi:hypothetical protein